LFVATMSAFPVDVNDPHNDAEVAHEKPPLLGPPNIPFWKRFQLIDWVTCVVMLVGIYMIQLFVRPHCREFRWNDDTIMYPKKSDTFPDWSVWAIAVGCGLLLILFAFLRPIGGHGTSWLIECNATLLMMLRALALASLLTTPIRHYTGVLRPDYLSRLMEAGARPPADLSQLVTYCEFDTNMELQQGRQTYPSGHATMTVAPSTVLVMYSVHRVGCFRRSSFLMTVLLGTLLLPALFCCFSRLRDNAHHPVDVAFGIVIGAFAGWVAFHISMVHVPLYVRRAQGIYADYRPRMGFIEDDGSLVWPYCDDGPRGMHGRSQIEPTQARSQFTSPRTDV
jgi:phosphatidate phosphatase